MSARPLASVIVPVGTVDDGVERQLRALVAQQGVGGGFEVLLAVNTTDRAAQCHIEQLVSSCGGDIARIVPALERAGAAYARNTGAAAAIGAILAFCDADDVAHPTWLSRMIAALDYDDAVGGRLVDCGLTPRLQQARPPTTPDALPSFLGVPYIATCSLAISREVFVAVGGFDESLVRCEDIAFGWAALRKGYTLGFASDAVLDYYHRPGLWPLLRQHYWYGRGMAQVLDRYGVPTGSGWSRGSTLGMLRPNNQPGTRRSIWWYLRKASLGAGRVVGLAEVRFRRRPTAEPAGEMTT